MELVVVNAQSKSTEDIADAIMEGLLRNVQVVF